MTAPLPQLRGQRFVTDGGLETDLIFHHGLDLPEFAAFPLLETDEGRAQLRRYYDGYAAVARAAGAGLLLEAPTWRANADWGARLGYDAAALERVNAAAIEFLIELRTAYADSIVPILVGGMLGPRGDGYVVGDDLSADEAAAYHRPQLAVCAAAGADLATALTLTHPGEAIGIVLAARDVGIPVAISFTVETDGRLPNGSSLAAALAAVDAAAPPDYYLVNCAHPTHVAPALADPTLDRARIVGTRVNASAMSHAELDAADELDEGDLDWLVATQLELATLLPALTVVGGCCGTDARHVAALWGVTV